MYSARSTHPNLSPIYGEITRERTKDKVLLKLKRSHSAMSSNTNEEDVQFRDDGEVGVEGGGGREGSGGGAEGVDHRYSTLPIQNHVQYQQSAPPSMHHPRPHSSESAQQQHSRIHQQFQYPSMHEQQQLHYQQHLQWHPHDPHTPLEYQQRVVPSSVMQNPQTLLYPHPLSSEASFHTLKSSSTEFVRHRQTSITPMIEKTVADASRGGVVEGGGGFGIVGRTPPTGGSYGSFATSIPTPQQHGVGVGGFDSYGTYAPPAPGTVIHRPNVEGVGMRVGGLHGNTRFQPTPVVPRGGGIGGEVPPYNPPILSQQMRMQSPGMQYYLQSGVKDVNVPPPQQQQEQLSSQRKQHPQSKQQMQRKKLDPVMEGNEDEDPSMLRYESRPGMDASPMVEASKDPNRVVGDEAGGQGLAEAAGATHGMTPSRSGAGKVRHGGIGQESRLGTSSSIVFSGGRSTRATLPVIPMQQPTTSDQAAEILHEFPFFFDGYAAWVCQHCQHIPPYYRGANYVWQSSQPPPNSFVDSHLRVCHGLNSTSQSVFARGRVHLSQEVDGSSFRYPTQQPQGPYPYAQGPIEHPLGHQQPSMSQQSYDSSLPPGAPDPPGVRSPVPGHNQQGIKRGRVDKMSPGVVAGQSWDSQPLSYPYQPHHSHASPGSFPPFMQVPPSAAAPTAHHHVGTEDTPPRAIKKRKTSSCKTSPKGRQSDDDTYKSSIDFLTKNASDKATLFTKADSDVGQYLVDELDSNLLTDYFFHIMQQLVVCRFSEKDRKTRGGKRENVDIGYGGLQCIHCVNMHTSRKFFWSTVDRLANSFAEIPSHILKCKHCPDEVREALLVLKGRHHDQIQSLPRGSQKVFFRRVWRRLHDSAGHQGATPVRDVKLSSVKERGTVDPPMSALAAFAETALMSPDVAVSASNRLLTSAAKSLEIQSSEGGAPEEKCERVLLAIPDDKNWLSDNDCFVRNNIEVFTANQKDVERAAADRKYPIKLGQVGIRCVHCAMASGGANSGAVSYPYSISGIYESVREFQRLHLVNCQHIPQDVKVKSEKLVGASSSLSSVLRRYYVQAARALGLFDTQDDGVRAGGKPIPLPTSGFFQATLPNYDTQPTPSKDAPGTVLGDDGKGFEYADPTPRDAPGSELRRDAPDKNHVPGIEDAPGEKDTTYKIDAPGITPEDSALVEQV